MVSALLDSARNNEWFLANGRYQDLISIPFLHISKIWQARPQQSWHFTFGAAAGTEEFLCQTLTTACIPTKNTSRNMHDADDDEEL